MSTASRRVLGRALVALLVIGLLVCGWQGWRWWDLTRSDTAVSAAAAADRAAAATAGRDGVVAFNTLDYRQVDASLDRWAAVSTGVLHDQIQAERPKVVKSVTDAKTVTSARLIHSALTGFDSAGGTAGVIAVVEIRSMPDGKPTTTTRARFAGQVRRAGTDWKVSSMQIVQVGS